MDFHESVRAYLAREYELPPDMVEELVGDARDNLQNLERALISHVEEESWELVAKEAHQLKGVLAYLGVEELRELARRFEKEALEAQPSREETWHEHLCPLLKEFLAVL